MIAYFVTCDIITDGVILGDSDVSLLISDEFGSGPASSMVNIKQNINSVINTIYGIKCDNRYIKDKYKDIINTDRIVNVATSFYLKNISKEVYESIFATVILSPFVHFSTQSTFENLDKTLDNIKYHFGSHMLSTIKCGHTLFKKDTFYIAFECNRSYISSKLLSISNSDEILSYSTFSNPTISLVLSHCDKNTYNSLPFYKDCMLDYYKDNEKKLQKTNDDLKRELSSERISNKKKLDELNTDIQNKKPKKI